MDTQTFDRLIEGIEANRRGWLRAGESPNCDVWLNGRLVNRVTAVHRKKGVIRVTDSPIRADKHGKRFLVHTLRGEVTVTRR